LARSTKDTLAIAERLDRAGADLVSLSERIDTTTAAGKMVFRMLAVLAEFERDQISERTKAAMAHLRRTHRRISRVTPFGYDLDEGGDTLTPNPREQEAIALMRSMRASGKSLRQIAATLDEAGVATKSGRGWTAQTIRGILDRECA
jgi:DNA invertase Pin-like site-specific DNA recombinase